MKRLILIIALMLMVSVGAFAQITAVPQLMNFSGRLARPDGTPIADGTYPIRFSLWTAQTGGTEKWNQTLPAVTVKNGTFSVPLNTSTGAADKFNNHLWLEIKIGNQAPLTPRQPLASVAYAMKADSVKDGSITASSLANNAVTGAKIADGTITAADLAANALNNLSWLLKGNSGVTSGFLGTTDNHPLVLKVNNHPAMRYHYAENTVTPDFFYRSINTLGGSEINSIAEGVVGGTIAGGGRDYFVSGTDSPNTVNADFGTIGGGFGNTTLSLAGTVGGGRANSANGFAATVAGGNTNVANANEATISGGHNNTANGVDSTVSGGAYNRASGLRATVPGGNNNLAEGVYSFAAGNNAQALHDGSFVWADSQNSVFASTGLNQFLVRALGGVYLNGSTFVQSGVFHVDGGVIVDKAGLSAGAVSNGLRFGGFSGEGITSTRTAGNNQWGLDFMTASTPRLSIANWGGVGIGTQAPQFTLHVNGSFGINSLPFGDRRNVQWDSSSGQFFYDNSSRKHKENITPLKEDFAKLLDAQPVTYTRPGAPDLWEIGFIAEDFDALGLKKLVDYGKDGKTPEGINYEKICLYLTAIAKQQKNDIESLQAKVKEIEAVKADNALLNQQLTELAEIVRQVQAAQNERRDHQTNQQGGK